MTKQRKIEVFSTGCATCQTTIDMIQDLACPSCKVSILDMNLPEISKRAKILGVHSLPAVLIDGKLAVCCSGGGVDKRTLLKSGLGQAI